MSNYNRFIFKDYLFDAKLRSLQLYYSFDGLVEFNESYHFDFEFAAYDPLELERACQSLFLMAGVSYYKAYLSSGIVVDKGEIDKSMASFFGKTYQKGLGEFFYINKLDPSLPINFPVNTEELKPLKQVSKKGLLVGVGGGKDSLVTIELLRGQVDNLSTWSLSHRPQLEPLVRRIGLPHYWVERQWDRSLLEHNAKGALNGHVPFSAILACVGTVVSILSGKRDVIVSNEQSANEPSLRYKKVAINHQYSKSLEFEQDYQRYLRHTLGDQTRYYSFLRPFSEIYIASLFAERGFDKYKDVFSSCNRAFVNTSREMSWCGKCAKCAFTFLALSSFVPREDVELLWGGKNLLLDPSLERTYRQLLGIEGVKPLDCVGEVKESRSAMHLVQEKYPELAKYKFDLPASYDYRKFSANTMPAEILEVLKAGLEK